MPSGGASLAASAAVTASDDDRHDGNVPLAAHPARSSRISLVYPFRITISVKDKAGRVRKMFTKAANRPMETKADFSFEGSSSRVSTTVCLFFACSLQARPPREGALPPISAVGSVK